MRSLYLFSLDTISSVLFASDPRRNHFLLLLFSIFVVVTIQVMRRIIVLKIVLEWEIVCGVWCESLIGQFVPDSFVHSHTATGVIKLFRVQKFVLQVGYRHLNGVRAIAHKTHRSAIRFLTDGATTHLKIEIIIRFCYLPSRILKSNLLYVFCVAEMIL